jgi:hypothetical protein
MQIIKYICAALTAFKPAHYKPKFSFIKYYILWTSRIPRGWARSPILFNNKGEVKWSKLKGQLKEVRIGLRTLGDLNPKQHFQHPLFGHLNLKQAKMFIQIHTIHHLNIVNDILKAQSR